MKVNNNTKRKLRLSVGMNNSEEPTVIVEIDSLERGVEIPDEDAMIIEDAQ